MGNSWNGVENCARMTVKSKRRKHRAKMKRADRKRCTVYALSDDLGDIRYIGQTRLLIERRWGNVVPIKRVAGD